MKEGNIERRKEERKERREEGRKGGRGNHLRLKHRVHRGEAESGSIKHRRVS